MAKLIIKTSRIKTSEVISLIGHIILNVRDFSESEVFYDRLLEKLGFKVEWKDEDENVEVKSYRKHEHNLWIKNHKQSKLKEFVRDVGLDHIAFSVSSNEEVNEIYEMLLRINTTITRSPRKYPEYSGDYYALYFRDPNGIPLEVYRM